jgi:molecular chaperone DnaK
LSAEDEIILGIDLGTTFSAMAFVDRHGKCNILPNAEGHATTASVVHFYDRDACVVGEEAVKMVVVDAANVVRFIKRYMGEPDFTLEFFGKSYTPQELSAIILRKLKDDAEEALGRTVNDSVITVPAYFNAAQRSATADAGALAGFNVLSIINEPTAAAISYGLERLGTDRNILVFDLGGGTFDVTVMEIRGTSLRTVASDGNAELGGKDWDDRLLNHVADSFQTQFGLDPRDDPQPYQELYERCLHAKISLSTKPRAVIPVNYQGHRAVVPVTREEFETLTADLLEQCEDTCNIVLEKARMKWSDIDDVILAGGSTRMPMVRRMLERLSGKDAASGVNPDECVAVGAGLAAVFRHRTEHPALQAYRLANAGNSEVRLTELTALTPSASATGTSGASPTVGLPGVQITDVATHPLGIVVLDGTLKERIINLIPEFTSLPCDRRGRFAYAYDNMTAVRVEITEGHGDNRDEVVVIGEVILDHLPPRPRGTPIEVVYRYTVNQILEVDVTDVETRQMRRARINLRGSIDEVQKPQARERIRRASIT